MKFPGDFYTFIKAHFHSGKFSAERQFYKTCLADTNFPSEKHFEVENFQLLTMIFSENFLSRWEISLSTWNLGLYLALDLTRVSREKWNYWALAGIGPAILV